MKKILLVFALVLCFLNFGKVFALDDQEVDLYEGSMAIVSLDMFGNRLYSSTADNSIYWVIDLVTFESQQYWYVYDFAFAIWMQPIDTTNPLISDFYSFLDVEETYIIFDTKAWQTAYLASWVDVTAIGIFTTNVGWDWMSKNGVIGTYYTESTKNFNTIEDLVTNLKASSLPSESSLVLDFLKKVEYATLANNINLTVFTGSSYVWDNGRQELLFWDALLPIPQYIIYNDTYGFINFYDYITPLKNKYALLVSANNYKTGYEAGEAEFYPKGKADGIQIGFVQGVLNAYSQGFANFTQVSLINLTNPGSQPYANGFTVGRHIGQLEGSQTAYDDGYDEGFDAGVIATEPEAFQSGYNQGYTDKFASGFDNWIVPAIATVIIVGGIMSVVAYKNSRREDL